MTQLTGPRLSGGGMVVRDSLLQLGFSVDDTVRPLTETVLPSVRRPRSLLVQNAWSVIDTESFRQLSRPYPRKQTIRRHAIRAVAALNLARAERVVYLSQSMADSVRQRRSRLEVAPVTVPLDALEGLEAVRPVWLPEDADFFLVPGTITWYKDPTAVLALLPRLDPAGARRVVFAGSDDQSGCADLIRKSLPPERLLMSSVTRAEMAWLAQHAELTLLFSRLESLSFSLGEALLWSGRVAATRLPVHVEVAVRFGREPVWLTPGRVAERPALDMLRRCLRAAPAKLETSDALRIRLVSEWQHLGRVLGLETSKP